MKKTFLIVCILFVGTILICKPSQESASLRFRVIGASDEKEDVENKMQVAENVGKVLEKERFKTVFEAESWISQNMETIENVSRKTLSERGNSDEVEAFLRDEYYEDEKIYILTK